MSIDINKDYGISIYHKGLMNENYTLKYKEEHGSHSNIMLSLDEMMDGIEVVKDGDKTVTIVFRGSSEMTSFVDFCREIVKGYDDFQRLTNETIYCGNCGHQQPFYIEEKEFKNGTIHHEARCVVCDSWMKFIPQDKELNEVIMPFGKYKGQKLVEIQKDYLSFVLHSGYVKGNLKKQINEVLYGKSEGEITKLSPKCLV